MNQPERSSAAQRNGNSGAGVARPLGQLRACRAAACGNLMQRHQYPQMTGRQALGAKCPPYAGEPRVGQTSRGDDG